MTDTKKTKNKSDDNPALKLVEESMKVTDEASSLATIRDILFGEQVKDVEQKRQDLHKEFKQSLNSLRQETRAQFEQISADIQTLYRLLNDETEQRVADTSETQQHLDNLKSALDDSNNKHLDAQDALQLKIMDESTRLETQARQWNDEILAQLDVAAKELKSDKTDRGDLAKMLRGVAEQLLDEQKS